MMLFRNARSAVCATILLATPALVHAQTLAPHRAVYDVALQDVSDRSGINGMDGRIVYEFQGSECDGYTTNFRFVTRIRSSSGDRLTDQQTSTYEDGSGDFFRFLTKSFVDERLDRELSGTAQREDGSLIVTLKKPQDEEVGLGPAMFPSAHILDLIERAKQGETFYEAKLFDGSEDADRVMNTSVIVGREKTVQDGDAEAAAELKDEPYRSVTISYFDEELAEGAGEALPDYEIAFKLYDNGVTRDLVMDYGDFTLQGTLVSLEMLPRQSCD